MGYLKILTLLKFMNESSQRILTWRYISHLWEKGDQGLIRESRVTTARTVSPLLGYNPTVSELSRQSPGLVTGTIDIPNMASNEPGPGSFQGIWSKRRQGQRWDWRLGYNMDSSGVFLLKQFSFLFNYFKI